MAQQGETIIEQGLSAGSRILVTGDAGFIGRALCDLLVSNGFEVLGVDRNASDDAMGWRHETCDILDADRLKAIVTRFDPHGVVHLAARTDLVGETVEDYEANRGGVRNVCEAVAASPSAKRAIYTSTQLVCEIGHTPAHDEDFRPSTVYGESKIETEKIVRQLDGGGVEWCLTRPTTGWGPGMSAHYTSVLRFIEKGLFFHMGKGALVKHYFYIENIAYQYLKLLQAPKDAIHGQVFYLADEEKFSLRDYVNKAADAMGVARPRTMPLPVAKALATVGTGLSKVGLPFPFTRFRLRNIRTEYQFDLSRTTRVCGPVPVSFDEGVRRTVAWYRER